jgi:hypothetical protein
LVWILGAAFRGPAPSDTLDLARPLVELLRFGLCAIGVVCAIAGLCYIRRFGTKGILTAALVGLFFDGGALIFVFPKQLPKVRARLAQGYVPESHRGGAVMAGVEPARNSTPPPVVPQPPPIPAPDKPVVNYAAVQFHQLTAARTAAIDAAEREKGEDAAVLKAWAAALSKLIESQAAATSSEKSLVAADVFNPSGVKSSDDFVRRRGMANAWWSAVHQWESEIQRLSGLFFTELAQRGVSSERREIELERLKETRPAAKDATALCKAEKEVASQYNYTINVLEEHWIPAGTQPNFKARSGSERWKTQSDKLKGAIQSLNEVRQARGLPAFAGNVD